jgi:hypothetical protein
MSQQPDHELEELRPDPDVPPRPEEEIADELRGEPAQGEGEPNSY